MDRQGNRRIPRVAWRTTETSQAFRSVRLEAGQRREGYGLGGGRRPGVVLPGSHPFSKLERQMGLAGRRDKLAPILEREERSCCTQAWGNPGQRDVWR